MTSVDIFIPLPDGARALAAGREGVRGFLASLDLPHAMVARAAEVLTCELVSNAVRHAGGTPGIKITLSDDRLIIAVADRSPAPPSRRPPDSTGGRGLMLVDSLADSWGFNASSDGKTVWATLRVQQ